MRIVAVADTHLFHDELTVPAGDVFIHAGDLCRGGDLHELALVASWIRALPHRHKIVVPGNHDFAFQDRYDDAAGLFGEGVTVLCDRGVRIEGMRFWGSPWQPAFNDWAFNLPRGAALAEKWALIPDDTDVLITHGPPAGFGDRSSVGGRQGCESLRARVEVVRPRVHLFGHIHEDGGAWEHQGVCFINATTWECERPPTVLDFTAGGLHVAAPPARQPRI